MKMENVSINMSLLCEEAKTISETLPMKIILILECIVGVLAIFPNLLTIILLFRIKVFHLNLRVLLGHLSFDLVFYSISLAEKASRHLRTPFCKMPMLFRECIVQEWAITIPLHNVMLALVILLLERLYSTIRFRTYDRSSRWPTLALVLFICSWTSTLSVQLTNYASANRDLWISICETSFVAGIKQILTITGSFVCLETVAIALMIFVYTYNRFMLRRMVINRAQFDLSARFQIDQNVKVNAALMPSAVLHVICYLPTYTFLLWTYLQPSAFKIETQAWCVHLTFLWRLVYAFAHPTILLILNPNLRQGFRKTALGRLFPNFGRQKSQIMSMYSASAQITDAHFTYLRRMWSTPDY